MATMVRCGLIQTANACPVDEPIEKIKQANIENNLKFISEAAQQGVQIACLQEVFTTPYFCAEQQTRWYEAVEKIPDGPTVKLMQEVAKQHNMVIVVPIYEEEITGIYYNTAAVSTPRKYLGKYRKNHIQHTRLVFGRVYSARKPVSLPSKRLRAHSVYIAMTGTFPKARARSGGRRRNNIIVATVAGRQSTSGS